MIVVDTCIITHLFNATELTDAAQQVFDINPDWYAPTTWREEYANVLAKLCKKNKYKPKEVLELFQTTCEAFQNREYKIDTKDALECAMQYQISVYDAHFIVLAEQLNTGLITEDMEVLKKCPKYAICMREYVANSL
jgi:predicted nucleic acid-binding protein